jgi:hypothetical protein
MHQGAISETFRWTQTHHVWLSDHSASTSPTNQSSLFDYVFKMSWLLLTEWKCQASNRNLRPTIPPKTPPLLFKLIENCWTGDPNARPSILIHFFSPHCIYSLSSLTLMLFLSNFQGVFRWNQTQKCSCLTIIKNVLWGLLSHELCDIRIDTTQLTLYLWIVTYGTFAASEKVLEELGQLQKKYESETRAWDSLREAA